MAVLEPRPGFNWQQVAWGGPDELRTDRCSYCGDVFLDGAVPLTMWNREGWCAEFCEHCQAAWWGIEVLPEPPAGFGPDLGWK